MVKTQAIARLKETAARGKVGTGTPNWSSMSNSAKQELETYVDPDD